MIKKLIAIIINCTIIILGVALFMTSWVSTPIAKLMNNPIMETIGSFLPENIIAAIPENGEFTLLSIPKLIGELFAEEYIVQIAVYGIFNVIPLIIVALLIINLIKVIIGNSSIVLGLISYLFLLAYGIVFIYIANYLNDAIIEAVVEALGVMAQFLGDSLTTVITVLNPPYIISGLGVLGIITTILYKILEE